MAIELIDAPLGGAPHRTIRRCRHDLVEGFAAVARRGELRKRRFDLQIQVVELLN